MKALYIRVSTQDQNTARQNQKGFDRVFVDKVSGVVPFQDRPAGSELTDLIKDGVITSVHTQDIDRLGRDLRDILKTIEFFEGAGVVLHVESVGASHVDGKKNPIFNLMVGILGTIAQMEREKIRERVTQGVAIAKAAGKYTGRKVGTTIPRAQFLDKYAREKRIIKANQDLSVAKLMKLTGRGKDLVKKIKDYIKE